MVELSVTFVIDKLRRMCFLSIYRYPIRMNLHVEEMWHTVLKFVNGELKIFVKSVELL